MTNWCQNFCTNDDFFRTYYTIKVVAIKKFEVKITYICILLAVFAASLANLFYANRFCEFEPILANNYGQSYWWNTGVWYDKYVNERNANYCNGSLNTDFYFDQNWQYINNTCAWDLEPRHVAIKYGSDQLVASTSLGLFNGSTQTNVAIIPHTEYLGFEYGLNINIRDIDEPRPEIYFKQPNGDYDRIDQGGGTMTFVIDDLLRDAGIALDDRNYGTPDENAPELVRGNHILYRLSGVEIKFSIDASNHKYQKRPLDMQTRVYVNAEVIQSDSDYTWACTGWKMVDPKSHNGLVASFYSCDLRVTFSVSGDFCFFSWSALMISLVELTVMFSVASLIVDNCFTIFLKTFRDAKQSDEIIEWQAHRNMEKMKKKYQEVGRDYRETLEQKIALNAEASVFVGNATDGTSMLLQGVTPKSVMVPGISESNFNFNGGITPNMSERPSFVESPDSPSSPKKTVTFGGTHWSKLEQNADKHRANSLQEGNMVQLVGLTNHPSMDERTGYIEDTQIMKKIRLQDGTYGWVPEHNLAPVNSSRSPNDQEKVCADIDHF